MQTVKNSNFKNPRRQTAVIVKND